MGSYNIIGNALFRSGVSCKHKIIISTIYSTSSAFFSSRKETRCCCVSYRLFSCVTDIWAHVLKWNIACILCNADGILYKCHPSCLFINLIGATQYDYLSPFRLKWIFFIPFRKNTHTKLLCFRHADTLQYEITSRRWSHYYCTLPKKHFFQTSLSAQLTRFALY